MKPLIDGDILLYEIGNSAEYIDENGEKVIRDFEFAGNLIDQKIKEICAEVWATEEPTIFITNNRRIHKKVNRQRKSEGKPLVEYVPNFREGIAKKKEYKAGRNPEKPFHYDNLLVYLLANYECEMAFGMEADDLMSIKQWGRVKDGYLDTIICTRDKDLRITPGMHFGWECGRQVQYGPARVTELGEIRITKDKKKIIGNGLKFFYSQLVTGDSTDNIPGVPGGGPVTAFESVHDAESEVELFERVGALYKNKYGDNWEAEMREQADLLWMVRELNEDGSPVMYKWPEVN
ncbi:hypothetical protein [Pseudomonas phage PPAY]|nr:hypothetical protein [Pseudomonas phage PPAY]UCW44403.1 hypothetical protein [Pseudomonas phage PPAT]